LLLFLVSYDIGRQVGGTGARTADLQMGISTLDINKKLKKMKETC
jgi:hypothetical protein